MNFKELGLDNSLVEGLKKQGITEPTQIQIETFKHLLEGKDVIGESFTGSGKTLAYLLPLFQRIIEGEITNNYGIILTPTYELAVQVNNQVNELAKNSSSDIRSTVIMGNVNINRQIENLKTKPQIIIGTAGRIYELIKKKKIAGHLVKYLVIDEADKLMDNNNINETVNVRKCLMKDAQVMLFSASISAKTTKSTINILCEPIEISINSKRKSPDTISHYYIVTEQREKIIMLRRILGSYKNKKSLVFINRAYDIEEATERLKFHNYDVECIHGKTDKIARKNIVNAFKSNKLKILVATDLAARGLQIEGIDLVISMSIPEDSNDYLHRAGRCGRNGKSGISICIVTERELQYIKQYNKDLGVEFEEKQMFKGKISNKK